MSIDIARNDYIWACKAIITDMQNQDDRFYEMHQEDLIDAYNNYKREVEKNGINDEN